MKHLKRSATMLALLSALIIIALVLVFSHSTYFEMYNMYDFRLSLEKLEESDIISRKSILPLDDNGFLAIYEVITDPQAQEEYLKIYRQGYDRYMAQTRSIVMAARYNEKGKLVWCKKLLTREVRYLPSVTADPDGKFALLYDDYIWFFDGNGELVWEKDLHKYYHARTEAKAIYFTGDNKLIVTGNGDANIPAGVNGDPNGVYVILFEQNGEQVSVNVYKDAKYQNSNYYPGAGLIVKAWPKDESIQTTVTIDTDTENNQDHVL